MQVISIVNQKGGVGKTTLSSLLTFYLLDKRAARVLAIDLDSQRNLSQTLRQFKVEIPTTALFDEPRVALPEVRQGITLIHGTPQLANLERATAAEASSAPSSPPRRNVTHSTTGRPSAVQMRLNCSLSIDAAEANTPAPT